VTNLVVDRYPGTDGSLRLAITGDVDMASGERLEAVLKDAITDPRVDAVILDLGGVGFLDSNGIRVLIHGRGLATEQGVGFRVTNPQEIVRRVLEITGVLVMLTNQA
jgi:anti-anti-sigma factor